MRRFCRRLWVGARKKNNQRSHKRGQEKNDPEGLKKRKWEEKVWGGKKKVSLRGRRIMGSSFSA